jgi:hypothetical protein
MNILLVREEGAVERRDQLLRIPLTLGVWPDILDHQQCQDAATQARLCAELHRAHLRRGPRLESR